VSVSVVKEDILSAVAQELIDVLNAELRERYPEEGATHFRLDPDEVAEGRGAFVVAYLENAPVGCGSVRTVEEGVGEIKRMYVRPQARCRGIARAVLEALEGEARRLGLRRLRLETGKRQHEAIALYSRAGYLLVPAFGEYASLPLSVCMAKDL
jgi:GNAT superfamily N-acetyltransferase